MIRLVVAVAVAVLAGACAAVAPEAPIVVSGTLVDGTGRPVPGAHDETPVRLVPIEGVP